MVFLAAAFRHGVMRLVDLLQPILDNMGVNLGVAGRRGEHGKLGRTRKKVAPRSSKCCNCDAHVRSK